MPALRDVIIRQEQKFAAKKDEPVIFRAVLCDNAGLITGSGSVWADQDQRLIWYRPLGVTNAGQVRCVRIEPQLGLGVLVGVPDGSNELEVLSDDPFLRQSGSGQSYLAPNGRDFEPGGRLQIWLYSKAFVPLATLAGTNLSVSVVEGDYEDYQGVRQTFAGSVNFDISGHQPAGPNEHCLVGIYISSAGAIGSVAGATVATSATAPEPTWPAGSEPLSVVDLDDTQTTINFANDIDDRRLHFPYPGSGAILKTFLDAKGDLITATAADTPAILTVGTDGYVLTADSGEATGIKWALASGGWPFANVLTVDSSDADADYSTITTAIAAASAGDLILLNNETFTEDVALNKAVTIRGMSRAGTVITNATNTHTVIATAAGTLENLTVNNTSTTNNLTTVSVGGATNTTVRDCILNKTGAATNGFGYYFAGTGHRLIDTDVTASGATNNYAVFNNTASGAVTITRGKLTGATNSVYSDQSATTVTLERAILANSISNSGTTVGEWLDSNYDVHADDDEAGLLYRTSGLRISTITDHLNTAPSVTWAAYTNYVTPTAVTTIPSQYGAYYTGGGTGTTLFFGYLGSYSNGFAARCQAGIANSRCGIRMDDGSDTNAIMLFLEAQTGGLVKLRYLHNNGSAGAITDLWGGASQPAMYYWLNMARVGNTVFLYAGVNGPYIPVTTGVTFTSWTPTLMGFWGEHPTGGTTDAQYAAKWDAYI